MEKLNIKLQQESRLNMKMDPVITIRDYNNLNNIPSINGVPLVGDKKLSELYIVSENTTDGWALLPGYIPKQGEICLYTDTGRLKIGDGAVPIVDLPYSGANPEEVQEAIDQHAGDTTIHVTPEEKTFWNAKLNCYVVSEELVLTRN